MRGAASYAVAKSSGKSEAFASAYAEALGSTASASASAAAKVIGETCKGANCLLSEVLLSLFSALQSFS